MASASVRVALRVRPLSPQEQLNGEAECVTQLPGVPQIVIGADRAFTFDYVFSPEVSQEQIYDDSIQPLVKQFLQGYNATVLAYGQTGSGKTFSMGTGLSTSVVLPEMQGIVPRAIHAVWSHLDRKAKKNIGFTYSIEISFLELYNEDLIDLLNPRSVVGGSSGRGPSIREDSRGNMVLVGVERRPVTCEDDIIGYLHQGTLSRTTASTDMNRTSSRSHAIFTLFLRQQNRRSSAALATNGSLQGLEHGEPDGSPSIVSKIHFVDLAGSERMKRTGAAGNRVKEGISINAGLLALGNVISALGNASANGQQGKRPAHVPYRDSKLTRLLQDSLGGNSQTLMLACISPSEKNSSESLNTIRYANRARNIRNKVAVNFDKNSSVELSMLKTEVARLRGELSKLKMLRRQSSMAFNDQGADGNTLRFDAEIGRLESANAELSQRLEQALRRAAVLEHERNLLRAKVADLGGSADSTPSIAAAVLPDTPSSNHTGSASAGDGQQDPQSAARPNSVFTDGDVLTRSNLLTTMDRELSEQAERHEHQIDSVRRHYESKLELLQETLSIVQKERDVALQRLANSANTPQKPPVSKPSTPSSAAGHSNRRALGLDGAPSSMGTPTKLRLPNRVSKGAVRRDFSGSSTPVSRKSSAADLSSSSIPTPSSRMGSGLGASATPAAAQRSDSALVKELQDQLESLKLDGKSAAEKFNADSERLALQVQEQAKEIARLRRQRTGRSESRRYSFLPFKDSSWDVAKATPSASGNGQDGSPNILRAAFIKKVLEGELQRCVQARQMLRERDSYLMKQDELMNEQNDLLLCIQGIDSELEDDASPSAARMQRASERIEIIDAELHYLDLKVRDVEAEVAKLSESAEDSSGDPNASGLLSKPLIINMSGLAMRMVEDVVRIDYRAFSELFEHLSQTDTTGLAYLFMQDIIELRLVAHRDELARAELEEQSMDLRRTLLAMQKTALNAALTYERELGDAERKLNALQSPAVPVKTVEAAQQHQLPVIQMHPTDPSSSAGSNLSSSTATVSSDVQNESQTDGSRSAQVPSIAVATHGGATGTLAPLQQQQQQQQLVDTSAQSQRSVYESVRDRGILLRSAILSATNGYESESLSSASSSLTSRADLDTARDMARPAPTASSPLISSTRTSVNPVNKSLREPPGSVHRGKVVVKDLAEYTADFESEGGSEFSELSVDHGDILLRSVDDRHDDADPTTPRTSGDSAYYQESLKTTSSLEASVKSSRLSDITEHDSASSDGTTREYTDANDAYESASDSFQQHKPRPPVAAESLRTTRGISKLPSPVGINTADLSPVPSPLMPLNCSIPTPTVDSNYVQLLSPATTHPPRPQSYAVTSSSLGASNVSVGSPKSPVAPRASAQVHRKRISNTPIESDCSLTSSQGLAYNGESQGYSTMQPVSGSIRSVFFSEPEDNGTDEEIAELYRSGSGEFFRRPNLARNSSTHSRQRRRHLVRRSQRRSHQPLPPPLSVADRARTGHPASRSGITKRRGEVRKMPISLPIVPPEMLEYIEKRNPAALRVNDAEPLVASPTLLRQMNIPETGEYEENIAAFASFAVKKPAPAPVASIPKNSTLLQESLTHADSVVPKDELGAEKSRHGSESAGEPSKSTPAPSSLKGDDKSMEEVEDGSSVDGGNRYDPSVHVRFSVSNGSIDALRSSSARSDSTQGTPRSPEKSPRRQLRSPPPFHHAGSSSPYTNQSQRVSYASVVSDGEPSERVFKTTEHDIRTSMALSLGEQASSHSSRVFEMQPSSRLSEQRAKSPLSPRMPPARPARNTPSAPASPARMAARPATAGSDAPERMHRYLSPTEQINASLFSMIDAAKVDPEQLRMLREKNSAAKSMLSQADTEHFLTQFGDDYDACNQFDPVAQEVDACAEENKGASAAAPATPKPMKIRRRAHTSADADTEPAPSPHARGPANTSNAARQGGGRFSKLLSGIGLGGPKAKEFPHQGDASESPKLSGNHQAMLGYGGMAATTGMGRDRSHSDSTESRKAQVRKVSSAMDIQKQFDRKTGLPYSFQATKWPSDETHGSAMSRQRYSRPSTATPTSGSSPNVQFRDINKALPSTPDRYNLPNAEANAGRSNGMATSRPIHQHF